MGRVLQVRRAYEAALLAKPNVIGVGIGRGEDGDARLVVLVSQKMPLSSLAPAHRIPSELDGVRVEVRETGDLTSLPGWVGTE